MDKVKILAGILGVFILVGVVFLAYKLGQRQTVSKPTLPVNSEKVFCKVRPEVCTMECIQNPPYICGSDGKSYCNVCGACADPDVEWYMIQDKPCKP